MYKLVSEYGNEVVYTANETTKNQLLEKGFHIDAKETKPTVKTEKKPRRKKAQSYNSSKGDKANEQTEN